MSDAQWPPGPQGPPPEGGDRERAKHYGEPGYGPPYENWGRNPAAWAEQAKAKRRKRAFAVAGAVLVVLVVALVLWLILR